PALLSSTLRLHDALPISVAPLSDAPSGPRRPAPAGRHRFGGPALASAAPGPVPGVFFVAGAIIRAPFVRCRRPCPTATTRPASSVPRAVPRSPAAPG